MPLPLPTVKRNGRNEEEEEEEDELASWEHGLSTGLFLSSSPRSVSLTPLSHTTLSTA